MNGSPEIQSDKDVINEGRRQPLEGVEAPLRDQIVKKLYNKLAEEEIGEEIRELWAQGESARQEWLNRQREYLASWDDHLESDASGAFDGSSQLHIPLPFIVCKTLHARFLQALWQDPPCHTKARNEASLERVAAVQDTLRYFLMDAANYGKGVEPVVDKWVWDWITAGSGLAKWRWEVCYTRFEDVETVIEKGPPRFVTLEDGSEQAVDTFVPVEKPVRRTKKTFDGPVLDLVDAEDIVIIGGGGDPDLADAVIHKAWLTASQLWTLVDRKIFNEEAVKALIEAGESAEIDAGSQMENQRRSHAGVAEEIDGVTYYAVLEAHLKKDVDGSGITSDIVVWTPADSGEPLGATYLHRINKAGERPFVKIDFHLRKGQEHGVGMVELMYPLSKELDAIRNIRLDYGLLATMPFGFYRASSSLDQKEIKLEPGILIPVDNPQTDVFFPNLGNRTVFGMQEEAAIHQMIERLTSISDMSLGVISGQGAARTATGARALVGEMGANLDVYLRRLNRGWKKALKYLLHMLQQRCPAGLSFRLTGDTGSDYFRYIKSAEDLAGDFDIEVSPNSATSNPGMQQEAAMQVMQAVADPLAIQMGCVTPLGYYEAKKNLMQALQIKDYGRYFQKPQGAVRVLTPEEEANRVLRGIPVAVTPEQDHEGFLAYFKMIVDNDELLGQFNEEQTIALAAQAQKHEQMAAALKLAASQQANAAQMQRNAAMSAQQAPVGMSPQAGSMEGIGNAGAAQGAPGPAAPAV